MRESVVNICTEMAEIMKRFRFTEDVALKILKFDAEKSKANEKSDEITPKVKSWKLCTNSKGCVWINKEILNAQDPYLPQNGMSALTVGRMTAADPKMVVISPGCDTISKEEGYDSISYISKSVYIEDAFKSFVDPFYVSMNGVAGPNEEVEATLFEDGVIILTRAADGIAFGVKNS